MNEKFKIGTRKRYTKVKSSLDPRGHVLDTLFQEEVIRTKQYIELNDGPDAETRAGNVLLHLFQTAHPEAFVVLREALKKDYGWIVEMIDEYTDQRPFIAHLANADPNKIADVNEVLKKGMKKCYARVKSSLDPRGHVLDTLFQEEVITTKQYIELNDGPDAETRAGNVLLHLFQTAHPQAFVVFREALKKDYGWIVEMIDEYKDPDIVLDSPTHSEDENKLRPDIPSNPSELELVYSSREDATSRDQVSGCNSKSLVIVEFSKLVIDKLIGAGGYGKVFKARHLDFPGTVAYKRINAVLIQPWEEAELKDEAKIHMQLDHPNIVKCFAVVFEPENYGMLLEFMKHGEAKNFLINNNNLRLKLKIIKDVATGMKYLHSIKPHAVIHGDLKLENVLVSEDEIAKVCDFGFSRWKEYSKSNSMKEVPLGTVTHVPPERWRDSTVRKKEKFDVYSFGITMWEILTLKLPFAGERNSALIKIWVENGQRPDMGDIPRNVAKNVVDLMAECWDGEKTKRPSFEDILTRLYIWNENI